LLFSLKSIPADMAQGLRSGALIPGLNNPVVGNKVGVTGILEVEGVFLPEPDACSGA
jgi:hypothetical protein